MGTARLLAMRRWWAFQEWRFDLAHGVRTRGRVEHDGRADEDPAYDHAVQYQGVGPNVFRECFETLPIDTGPYTFVDVGCGRGRALVMASEHPFSRIVGVELDPALAADAEANAERLRERHADLPPIEVVNGNALRYEFPDAPLVVFLYNPFDETVLGPVVERLGESLAASGQPAFVIYTTPLHREIFDAAPFLELHAETGHGVVYRSLPVHSPERSGETALRAV